MIFSPILSAEGAVYHFVSTLDWRDLLPSQERAIGLPLEGRLALSAGGGSNDVWRK